MTKILLAEDDNDMRRFLVKALQNAGYDVASFDNGLSAYNRLREEPFELLLTDIVMPEMGGRVASARMQAAGAKIPFLFVSGYTMTIADTEFVQDPSRRFLPKPFNAGQLLREVHVALNP